MAKNDKKSPVSSYTLPEGFADYSQNPTDGFFLWEIGAHLEGLLLSMGTQSSKFEKDARFYKVKLTKAGTFTNGDGEEIELSAGSIVHLNDKYRTQRFAEWLGADKSLACVIVHVTGKTALDTGKSVYDAVVGLRVATPEDLKAAQHG